MNLTEAEAAISAAIAIENCESLGELKNRVRDFAKPFGFDRFAIFTISPSLEGLNERLYWLEGKWFNDEKNLDASTYFRNCPATQHLLSKNRPFFWSKVVDVQGKEVYHINNRPKGQGVHGLQIPIFGPLGLEGAVSLGGEQIDSSPKTRLLLSLVANVSFYSARRLIDEPKIDEPKKLSRREREILSLTAIGRRQNDIAATLSLSHRTIENHLRRVRQRLGVLTTAEAIRVAIRNGEIDA